MNALWHFRLLKDEIVNTHSPIVSTRTRVITVTVFLTVHAFRVTVPKNLCTSNHFGQETPVPLISLSAITTETCITIKSCCMLIRAVVTVFVRSTVKTMAGNVFANRTIWATDVPFQLTKRTYVCCTIQRASTGPATTVRTLIPARAPANPATKENNVLSRLMSVTPIRAKMGPNASTISMVFTVTALRLSDNTAENCAPNR